MSKIFGLYAHRQDSRSEPLRTITHAEALDMKRTGAGYFITGVRHMPAFRLFDPDDTGMFEEKYRPTYSPNLHGQSCKIDEKPSPTYHGMMSRFVEGDFLARAAVNAWRNTTRVFCSSAKSLNIRAPLRDFPGTLRSTTPSHFPGLRRFPPCPSSRQHPPPTPQI